MKKRDEPDGRGRVEDASARRRAQLFLLGLLSIWAIAVSWLILEAASIFELRGA